VLTPHAAEAARARPCYVRIVRLASRLALSTSLAVIAALAACTETPSYFPPCVDPYSPCVVPEGGTDASDDGGVLEGSVADSGVPDSGPTDGSVDGGLTDGGVTDGGLTDRGVTDGGLTDGGVTDGGLIDGDLTDGGLSDAPGEATADAP
jgi:hypothetical protein